LGGVGSTLETRLKRCEAGQEFSFCEGASLTSWLNGGYTHEGLPIVSDDDLLQLGCTMEPLRSVLMQFGEGDRSHSLYDALLQ
jgi:hypothetical protein